MDLDTLRALRWLTASVDLSGVVFRADLDRKCRRYLRRNGRLVNVELATVTDFCACWRLPAIVRHGGGVVAFVDAAGTVTMREKKARVPMTRRSGGSTGHGHPAWSSSR